MYYTFPKLSNIDTLDFNHFVYIKKGITYKNYLRESATTAITTITD